MIGVSGPPKDRSALLAVPENVNYTNIEYDLASDKRFDSIFINYEGIENEITELRLSLRGVNKHSESFRYTDRRDQSGSPKPKETSRFRLFYHHKSFNKSKGLYEERLDLKTLNYREFYEKMIKIIGKQLKPFRTRA